ncbi:hypothetical protein B0H19DRAFT_1239752 [Mycena capillaripes]|nr:hypothetical protein B0H19DRAFT_1239752 [Mycena capillaripes]
MSRSHDISTSIRRLISCESGATQTRYAQFDRLCSGVPPIEPTCLRLRYHIEFEVLNLTPCHPIAISNAPVPPFMLLMVFDANGGRHHQCVDLIFVVSIRSIHTADDPTSVSTCLAAPDSRLFLLNTRQISGRLCIIFDVQLDNRLERFEVEIEVQVQVEQISDLAFGVQTSQWDEFGATPIVIMQLFAFSSRLSIFPPRRVRERYRTGFASITGKLRALPRISRTAGYSTIRPFGRANIFGLNACQRMCYTESAPAGPLSNLGSSGVTKCHICVQRARNNGEDTDALDSDSDSDFDEEDDEMIQAREAAQSACIFDIDPDINISAPFLLDLVAPPSLASTAPTAVAQPQIAPVTQKKSEEVNWDF